MWGLNSIVSGDPSAHSGCQCVPLGPTPHCRRCMLRRVQCCRLIIILLHPGNYFRVVHSRVLLWPFHNFPHRSIPQSLPLVELKGVCRRRLHQMSVSACATLGGHEHVPLPSFPAPLLESVTLLETYSRGNIHLVETGGVHFSKTSHSIFFFGNAVSHKPLGSQLLKDKIDR